MWVQSNLDPRINRANYWQKTKLSYALVNLKPIVPGHVSTICLPITRVKSLTTVQKVLIVPLRNVPRLKDLTPEESLDFMETLQKVHAFIEHIYKADSLNIAIQDGPEAGQSVPHVHAHIIPRTRTKNIGDKIYEKLDDPRYDIHDAQTDFYKRKEEARLNPEVVKPDDQRFERTEKDMHREAQWLASELKRFYKG